MRVPDPAFADPRLAVLYDVFEDDRDDLEVYVALIEELVEELDSGLVDCVSDVARVIDLGCGTGELAVRLARRGHDVVGVDPAVASLDVARRKAGAEWVTWIAGDATAIAPALPDLRADVAVMTGNVAQVFVDDDDWSATLRGVHGALRPGGSFVFETRRPEVRAWERWVADLTAERTTVPDGRGGTTVVATWCDLLDVVGDGDDQNGDDPVRSPLTITFRWTYVFDPDGPDPETVVSDSTLRFRDRDQIERDLDVVGFDVVEVRDAPDRPGLEWVFVARARGDSAISVRSPYR